MFTFVLDHAHVYDEYQSAHDDNVINNISLLGSGLLAPDSLIINIKDKNIKKIASAR